MQNKKRILSVTIKRMIDDSPDTSYLGEYGNKAESEYAIDREHSLDCIENDSRQKEKLVRIADAIENDRPVCEEHTSVSDPDCETCCEEKVYTDAMQTVSDLLDCDCGGHGDRLSREYQYFNGPVENYLGIDHEEMRKYIRQDYDRMESMNRGEWCPMGVRAEASIKLSDSDLTQRISSGGLWGLESDMSACDWEETESEQLSELRIELKALGFSSRAISTAFKNIERKDS